MLMCTTPHHVQKEVGTCTYMYTCCTLVFFKEFYTCTCSTYIHVKLHVYSMYMAYMGSLNKYVIRIILILGIGFGPKKTFANVVYYCNTNTVNMATAIR